MNDEYGRPARTRRMALWHVGFPVEVRRLAAVAGIEPEERMCKVSVVTTRWFEKPRKYRYEEQVVFTDPVLTYLHAEEQHNGVTLPGPSWRAVLRELSEVALRGLQADAFEWRELVRWGWPRDQARDLWARVPGRTHPPPATTPATGGPPPGDGGNREMEDLLEALGLD